MDYRTTFIQNVIEPISNNILSLIEVCENSTSPSGIPDMTTLSQTVFTSINQLSKIGLENASDNGSAELVERMKEISENLTKASETLVTSAIEIKEENTFKSAVKNLSFSTNNIIHCTYNMLILMDDVNIESILKRYYALLKVHKGVYNMQSKKDLLAFLKSGINFYMLFLKDVEKRTDDLLNKSAVCYLIFLIGNVKNILKMQNEIFKKHFLSKEESFRCASSFLANSIVVSLTINLYIIIELVKKNQIISVFFESIFDSFDKIFDGHKNASKNTDSSTHSASTTTSTTFLDAFGALMSSFTLKIQNHTQMLHNLPKMSINLTDRNCMNKKKDEIVNWILNTPLKDDAIFVAKITPDASGDQASSTTIDDSQMVLKNPSLVKDLRENVYLECILKLKSIKTIFSKILDAVDVEMYADLMLNYIFQLIILIRLNDKIPLSDAVLCENMLGEVLLTSQSLDDYYCLSRCDSSKQSTELSKNTKMQISTIYTDRLDSIIDQIQNIFLESHIIDAKDIESIYEKLGQFLASESCRLLDSSNNKAIAEFLLHFASLEDLMLHIKGKKDDAHPNCEMKHIDQINKLYHEIKDGSNINAALENFKKTISMNKTEISNDEQESTAQIPEDKIVLPEEYKHLEQVILCPETTDRIGMAASALFIKSNANQGQNIFFNISNKIALLFAEMSDKVKRNVGIMTDSKLIAKEANILYQQVNQFLVGIPKHYVKQNLENQICKVPTLSGQLKIVSGVKSSLLNLEKNKSELAEANNALFNCAENLMNSINDALGSIDTLEKLKLTK